jgi:hypothetical protein
MPSVQSVLVADNEEGIKEEKKEEPVPPFSGSLEPQLFVYLHYLLEAQLFVYLS